MPEIVRVMDEEDGRPKLGASAATLGVRLPDGEMAADIAPDLAGKVHPGTGGMSVSPSVTSLLERLPPGRIPRRMLKLAADPELPEEVRVLLRDARGRDTLKFWKMGSGPFTAGELTAALALRPDPEDSGHGFVEPARTMGVQEYVEAIWSTRDLWSAAGFPPTE